MRITQKKHLPKEPTEEQQAWDAEEQALVAQQNANALSHQLFGVEEANHAMHHQGAGSKAVASTFQPPVQKVDKHPKQHLHPQQPGGRAGSNHRK
eukprot:g62634.t1